MMENTKLLLRVFAEASSTEEATKIGSEIVEQVEKEADRVEFNSKKYWKIPEYFEITFDINVVSSSEFGFSTLMSRLGTGWEFHNVRNGKWAVWNFDNNISVNNFCHSKVRWAHLEMTD